jgi:hypothetical protein
MWEDNIGMELDPTTSGEGPVTGCREHGNKSSCSKHGGYLPGRLGDSQLLTKNSVPFNFYLCVVVLGPC